MLLVERSNDMKRFLWGFLCGFGILLLSQTHVYAEEIVEDETVIDESQMDENNVQSEFDEEEIIEDEIIEGQSEEQQDVIEELFNGWNEDKTQYFIDSIFVTGLQKIDNHYYFFEEDGMAYTGFKDVMIKEKLLIGYFKDGLQKMGEIIVNSNHYYLNPSEDGALTAGFVNIPKKYSLSDAKMSYFDENGIMKIGKFRINNTTFTTDSKGKITKTVVDNVKYLRQGDPRWSGVYFGRWNIGYSGCVPTVLTMTYNSLTDSSYTPVTIARLLNKNGDYNVTEIGAGGKGITYFANYYGFDFKNNLTYDSMKNYLLQGYMIVIAEHTGTFTPYAGTHEILVYGYENGKAHVMDPYNPGNNRMFSLSTIWNERSRTSYDNALKGPAFAIRLPNKIELKPLKEAMNKYMAKLADENRDSISDGIYYINSGLNSNYVLSTNSNNVQLAKDADKDSQKWIVSHDAKGFVTFTNLKTKKVLSIVNSSVSNGANIVQQKATDSKNQKWIVVKTEEGYKIVSALSYEKVVDLKGNKAVSSANVQLYKSTGNADQSFDFTETKSMRDILNDMAIENKDVLSEGIYFLANDSKADYIVETKSGSTKSNALIRLYKKLDYDYKKWKLSYDENGYVTFQNVKTGLYLGVYQSKASTNTKIVQKQSGDSYGSKWIVMKMDSDYKIVSALNRNLYLDFSNDTIMIRTKNTKITQKWSLIETKCMRDLLDDMALENKNSIEDGTYHITSALNQLFSVYEKSTDGNVVLNNTKDVESQLWNIIHDEQGYVIFTNMKSNQVLSVASSNVKTVETSSNYAQKWIVLSTETGYKIVSATNKYLVLDIENNEAKRSQNIQVYKSSNKLDQRWYIS